MGVFAGFDGGPAMALRVVGEAGRCGRTDGRKDGRTDARTDNVKTVYPLQTKFAGGINMTMSVAKIKQNILYRIYPKYLHISNNNYELILNIFMHRDGIK